MAEISIKVGAPGYRISLLTVSPGKEGAVTKRLAKAIKKETKSDPVCLLKIFGQYDVCAIYETMDFMAEHSKAGSIDNIRGSNQIIAFPLLPFNAANIFKSGNKGVWGLLFFRFNESLAKQFGSAIESVIVQHWKKFTSKDISLDIFGTTGWAELLFIVRGKRFSDVTMTLSNISQQAVIIQAQNKEKIDLFSAKTYSLLGIDFNFTQPPLRGNLHKEFSEEFTYGKGVFPSIDITCAPGNMKSVIEYGEKKFGLAYSTFGGKDLVFRAKGASTWGQFIKDVLEIRKKLSNRLYSTSVNILCKQSTADYPNFPVSEKKWDGLRVTKSHMKLLKRWGPIFENSLRNLYFGISNLLQDPLIGNCFKALRPTIETRLPFLLRKADPNDDSVKEFMGLYIEAIAHGAEERAHGAFLALESLESRFSPTKGGIQRILKAAGVIAKTLLAKSELEWMGFMIAGLRVQGFSSHADIINLPFDMLYRPDDWWGLFHEIGHVAFSDPSFIDLDGEEIQSHFVKLVPDQEDEDRVVMWKSLIWEVGADTFDMYFCYGKNIDFYLSNIWSYIAPPKVKLDDLHFIRHFCVYQYWQYMLQRRNRYFPSKINLEEDVKKFREKLKGLNLKVPKSKQVYVSAEKAFDGIKKIIEIFHREYSKKAPLKNLNKDLRSKETKESTNCVLKGQVFLKPIKSPATFILGLKKRQQEMTFQARMAAILSLWNTAVLKK
jgi:hypothetical protein